MSQILNKQIIFCIRQEEDWFKFRSIVNPVFLKPNNILPYVAKMNAVADQFVDNINFFSKQDPNGEMPFNFLNEVYKWSLESISIIAMNKSLGCLKREDKNYETDQMIQSALTMLKLMYKLDVMPSISPFYSKTWKQFCIVLDYLLE